MFMPSGAGNCVCSRALGDKIHVQAAPGVPIPEPDAHVTANPDRPCPQGRGALRQDPLGPAGGPGEGEY